MHEELPDNEQGEQRTHKRRSGEHHRFMGGTEITQGQQIEPDREAVTKGVNRQKPEANGWVDKLFPSNKAKASIGRDDPGAIKVAFWIRCRRPRRWLRLLAIPQARVARALSGPSIA